jgi:hypothetical protein
MKEHPKRQELEKALWQFSKASFIITSDEVEIFLDNLITLFEPEWIPVTERLPEINTKTHYSEIVIVSCDSGLSLDFLYINGWYSYNYNNVTHWTPLPKNPPKK